MSHIGPRLIELAEEEDCTILLPIDVPTAPLLIDPTTWSVVAVDGDADGDRNPQDLDDAALALAVRLCSELQDLRSREGLRAAVSKLSSDDSFVDVVLSVDAVARRAGLEKGDVLNCYPWARLRKVSSSCPIVTQFRKR